MDGVNIKIILSCPHCGTTFTLLESDILAPNRCFSLAMSVRCMICAGTFDATVKIDKGGKKLSSVNSLFEDSDSEGVEDGQDSSNH